MVNPGGETARLGNSAANRRRGYEARVLPAGGGERSSSFPRSSGLRRGGFGGGRMGIQGSFEKLFRLLVVEIGRAHV